MNDVPGVPGGPEERTWTLEGRVGGRAAVAWGNRRGQAPLAPGERVEVVESFWRERSRGLEAALRHIEHLYEDGMPRPRDAIRDSVLATVRASLSAVPVGEEAR